MKKYLVFHQFIIIIIILLILKRRLRSSTFFFANQCTLVENTSKLPIDSFKRANKLLSNISFTKDDIAKIIKNLNPNESHSFDVTSMPMLKFCGDSILKSLELVFKSCIRCGNFSIEWEKTDVAAVHNKITNS